LVKRWVRPLNTVPAESPGKDHLVETEHASPLEGQNEDFHIGGSDAAGIVYAVGPDVEHLAVGDEVIVHHGWWDSADPWVRSGRDPMIAPSAKIWGYNTNYGSFAQFSVAQAHQCLPKPRHLTWEEAAAATLVGTTAYRMLFGWEGSRVQSGDVVLVCGAGPAVSEPRRSS
jgi:crotonyl-CoA carboxylase/reductase